MKSFVIALILVAMAVSPAMAQQKQKTQQMAGNLDNAEQAYAWVPADSGRRGRTESVWLNGEYLGADPDPFIRSQLLRDPPARQGGQ